MINCSGDDPIDFVVIYFGILTLAASFFFWLRTFDEFPDEPVAEEQTEDPLDQTGDGKYLSLDELGAVLTQLADNGGACDKAGVFYIMRETQELCLVGLGLFDNNSE